MARGAGVAERALEAADVGDAAGPDRLGAALALAAHLEAEELLEHAVQVGDLRLQREPSVHHEPHQPRGAQAVEVLVHRGLGETELATDPADGGRAGGEPAEDAQAGAVAEGPVQGNEPGVGRFREDLRCPHHTVIVSYGDGRTFSVNRTFGGGRTSDGMSGADEP